MATGPSGSSHPGDSAQANGWSHVKRTVRDGVIDADQDDGADQEANLALSAVSGRTPPAGPSWQRGLPQLVGKPLAHDKLGSVHLNDQNGLKYDQDKNFGGANLRVAFNQVRVLEEAGYGSRGEFIGLDVKAMRTQKGKCVTDHLKNSREIFMHLVQKVRTWDRKLEQQYIDARDYEALELAVLKHIMGVK
jgi:hypothetical protein